MPEPIGSLDNERSTEDAQKNVVPIENWPDDVVFLDEHSIASADLPCHLRLHLCTAPKKSNPHHPHQPRSQQWTCVKLIDDTTPFQPAFGSSLTTHPAIGQSGLFARRDIPPNTYIVPYLGEVHLTSCDDKDSRYDAAIEADDGTRLGIDATRAGNEARFVNDYRGILQRPNLFFQEWTARLPVDAAGHKDAKEARVIKKVKGLALYTGAHAIRAGTELCVSYGKGWWAARS